MLRLPILKVKERRRIAMLLTTLVIKLLSQQVRLKLSFSTLSAHQEVTLRGNLLKLMIQLYSLRSLNLRSKLFLNNNQLSQSFKNKDQITRQLRIIHKL